MNHTTKTAQFTQGPWVVDEDYEDEEQQAIGIVKEGHGYIAGIHILASCNNGEGFTAEDRANAALIAAAPAMYEALTDAERMWNIARMIDSKHHAGNPISNDLWSDFHRYLMEWHAKRKAALTQAEGNR